MFTTDLVNLYNRNIFKTSLYIYIFHEKCRNVLWTNSLKWTNEISSKFLRISTYFLRNVRFYFRSKKNKIFTFRSKKIYFCERKIFKQSFEILTNLRISRKEGVKSFPGIFKKMKISLYEELQYGFGKSYRRTKSKGVRN